MISFINEYIFGRVVPLMLVLAGLYYTVILRGFHIFKPIRLIKGVFKKNSYNGVSPIKALSLALAGTLGVGNIVGVSAAISLGGFGSIFWMWISAFCAMLLKYAEIVLAMRHRGVDEDGKPCGSAMLYIKDYFNSLGFDKLAKIISCIFAILCIVNSVSMGSMIQMNSVSQSIECIFNFSPLLTGIFCSVIVAVIISRGRDGIMGFTEKLVPIMSIGYVVISLAVLIIKRDMIFSAFYSIFTSAFTSDSISGGILGFVMSRSLRYGTMRGLISNEAGCGTAPTAHATSDSRSVVEQGFFGIIEVFVDTIVLCTMTALVVIISYPSVRQMGNNFIMMTINSYSAVLGDIAKYFLVIAVFCFAIATVVCWAFYGIESVRYISYKKSSQKIFIFIYVMSVCLGTVINSDVIWECADFAIGAMTLINVTIITLMSKEVREETRLYFSR